MASSSLLILSGLNSYCDRYIPQSPLQQIYSGLHFPLCKTSSRFRGICGDCRESFKLSAFSSSVDISPKKWSDDEFIVVNFYNLVRIENPEEEVSRHLSFMQERDIHGRIYLNEQGINAQYSGPRKDALAYVEWLKQDYRFSDILVQISPAINGHAFPRLKLRYKPSLVQLQLEEGTSKLPLLDPSMRATPLLPSQWRCKLEEMNDSSNTAINHCILLDVRNGYEWDVGHFQGAERPDVDCFRSTTFGQAEPESKVVASDPLAFADKEKTDILMYCTGGIRCDVYSTVLRQRGFKRLFTLKGGVSHYVESEGPVGWVGNLFVFDARLSVPAGDVCGQHNTFGSCYVCGSLVSELRHRNCANLDCNLLFLCCRSCVDDLRGCCCSKCTSAKRLRPVLWGHERYQKWHRYRHMGGG